MVELHHVVCRPTYGVVFPKEHYQEAKPVYFANCSGTLTLWGCVWKCKVQSVWWIPVCTTCSLWIFWKLSTIILWRLFFNEIRNVCYVYYSLHYKFCEGTESRCTPEVEHISYIQNCSFTSKPHIFGCWIGWMLCEFKPFDVMSTKIM